jgi:hypothetical protein
VRARGRLPAAQRRPTRARRACYRALEGRFEGEQDKARDAIALFGQVKMAVGNLYQRVLVSRAWSAHARKRTHQYTCERARAGAFFALFCASRPSQWRSS